MTEEIEYIEPLVFVRNETFSAEDIPESELIMEIGSTYFRFVIKNGKAFVGLEDFTYPVNKSKIIFLEELFNQHPFLSARFWKNVKVILHAERKIVVPIRLENDQAESIWKSLYSKMGKDKKLMEYPLPRKQTLIYETDAFLFALLTNFYIDKKIDVIPAEALLPFMHSSISYLVFDGVGSNLVWHDNQLNTYYSSDWSQLLKLRSISKILLVGEITEYAKSYRRLLSIKPNLAMASINPAIKLSPIFQDLPKHRYFILFNS